MENFKIEVEETKTYWQRMKLPLIFGFIIYMSWSLFVFLLSPKMHGPVWIVILLVSLIVVIYIWGCDNTCAYYITTLEISKNHLHIIYKKRNREFELNDLMENFTFKKGINRPGPYFSIAQNGKFIVKQYKRWKWKEAAFNYTINYLTSQKLVKINWL